MFDCLWNYVARTLQRHPKLIDRLIARAQRTPYFDLEGYMNRWWILPPPVSHGKPGFWLVGNQLRRLLPFSIRIHQILRADRERHLHNHPWTFRTIILTGWYSEEYLTAGGDLVNRVVWAGESYRRRVGEFHRINAVPPKGVYTLVLHRNKSTWWGFLVDGVCVYWRTYFFGEPMPERLEDR